VKAVIVNGKGSFDEVLIKETDKPVVNSNELLVKIHAAGVNPVDFKVVLHGYFPRPLILGSDIAGTVEAVGDKVKNFKPGDEIIGSLEWQKQSAFAEYVATEEKYITHKPVNISFAEAAGVPLAGLTAWQALFDNLYLQKGQRIVIHAAAGGVGLFALQLAKWAGAYVIGTASERNRDFLLSVGADEVVDYTKYKLSEKVTNADAVLDSISTPEVQEESFKSLKTNGAYVSIVDLNTPVDTVLLAKYKVHAQKFLFRSDADQLKKIVTLIEEGHVKVFTDKIFDLKDARAALEYVHTARARGKVVLANN
jgi:NADPH:quinone reductase-like Zn-dependent oxidoreductase